MSSKNYKSNKDEEQVYDKHMEHLDQTRLGKLQQQYWTTKQQVIKKLGKKEDEFIVASDAELDAKLELFEAIEQSSVELLKIIEMYQDKLITLSIEEAEMSHFLKSQSTYDTKTKAGKMMAAVSKAQNFSSQQRATMRLPLVRLFNDVETFLNRAIADTYLTIRKMESARTEYRGALLWMKNISLELDPDTSKKLEKFRRVQAQVKKTKTKFDRLKSDVIQKIELLSASRCNMFSNVLLNYLKSLIQYWEKTSRAMNAVSDAFKGYQYYEFNVIKDLVEPSKKLAKIMNEPHKVEEKDQDQPDKVDNKSVNNDLDLLKLNDDEKKDEPLLNLESSDSNILDLGEQGEKKSLEDQVNELIDLMTLNEANNLNEQLRELEQLEFEKRQKENANQHHSASRNSTNSNSILSNKSLLFDLIKSPLSSNVNNNNNNNADSNTSILDGEPKDSFASTTNDYKSFTDLISHASDAFEREWQSVLNTPSNQQGNSPAKSATISPSESEFGLFQSSTSSSSAAFAQNLFADEFNSMFAFTQTASNPIDMLSNKTKQDNNNNKHIQPTQQPQKESWLNLFAELDPLKNPDAIGKNDGSDEQRNC